MVQSFWVSDEGTIICSDEGGQTKFEDMTEEQFVLIATCSDGDLYISKIPRHFDGITITLYAEDVFGYLKVVCSFKVLVHSEGKWSTYCLF